MTLLIAILSMPLLMFASGAEHHDVSLFNSDFIYRVLNFSVFIGIVYYLVANPIREFFIGRRESIAKQLEEIEAKLQASKDERLLAEENVAKAEIRANEIVLDATNEAKMLADKIAEKNAQALILLEKQAIEKQALASKKAREATIKTLLNDGIDTSDITINEAKVVSLISNKVA